MATGDRLYIADKPTLDQVKTKVDSIESKVSTREREYYTVSDLTNKLRIVSIPISLYSDLPRTLAEGSGILYGILYTGATVSGYSVNNILRVSIDDTSFYSGAVTNNGTTGIITPNIMAGNIVPLPDPRGFKLDITNRNITTSPTSAGSDLYYLPRAIKFNSSLQIIAYPVISNLSITNVGYVYCVYELD